MRVLLALLALLALLPAAASAASNPPSDPDGTNSENPNALPGNATDADDICPNLYAVLSSGGCGQVDLQLGGVILLNVVKSLATAAVLGAGGFYLAKTKKLLPVHKKGIATYSSKIAIPALLFTSTVEGVKTVMLTLPMPLPMPMPMPLTIPLTIPLCRAWWHMRGLSWCCPSSTSFRATASAPSPPGSAASRASAGLLCRRACASATAQAYRSCFSRPSRAT